MNYPKYYYSAAIIITVLMLTGCPSAGETLKAIRDPDMNQGCYVTVAGVRLDSYLKTTQGSIDTCRLNCSPDLPKSFKYCYTNPMVGCTASVGYSGKDGDSCK